MAAAEATRSYVQEVLRPKMYQVLGQDAFLLEAMSTSYVGRAVMDRLKEHHPGLPDPASRPPRPEPRFRPQTLRDEAD